MRRNKMTDSTEAPSNIKTIGRFSTISVQPLKQVSLRNAVANFRACNKADKTVRPEPVEGRATPRASTSSARTAFAGRTSQPRNFRPIATNHRFFLLSTPPLNLPLRRQRLLSCRKVLRKHHLKRPPTKGIARRNCTGKMLCNTSFEIIRMPCVIATVRTPKHVNQKAHPTSFSRPSMPGSYGALGSNPPGDKLRANGCSINQKRRKAVRPELVEG